MNPIICGLFHRNHHVRSDYELNPDHKIGDSSAVIVRAHCEKCGRAWIADHWTDAVND